MKDRSPCLSCRISMVGARGFEPPAFCSQSRRATGLRHAPRNFAAVCPVLVGHIILTLLHIVKRYVSAKQADSLLPGPFFHVVGCRFPLEMPSILDYDCCHERSDSPVVTLFKKNSVAAFNLEYGNLVTNDTSSFRIRRSIIPGRFSIGSSTAHAQTKQTVQRPPALMVQPAQHSTSCIQ